MRNSGKIWSVLASLEVELDLKGNVAVVGKVYFVNVSEIKSLASNSNLRKGKGHMKVHALMLRWAL